MLYWGMSVSSKVKEKLQKLPDKPGVYLMRDRHGRIIYVGKAVSLRSRVRSYFQKGTLKSAPPKLRGLIKSIDDLEFIAARTEAEAILNEGRLIKEYRPRYNVSFRDDKRFLLLRVNLTEKYPRLSTSRIKKDDGASYFGPYASSAGARAAMEYAEKRFGLRVCRPRIPGEQDHRHCMNDVIRYCSAPCIRKIDEDGYRERVKEACSFLRGERSDCLEELQEQMEQEASKHNFERAAAIRDTLFLIRDAIRKKASGLRSVELQKEEALEGVVEIARELGLAAPPDVIECFDISNISGTYAVGSMVCAVSGMPRRNRYRLFRIKTIEGIDDPAMMNEVVARRYERLRDEKKAMPDLVIVDGGITQLNAARAALNELGLTALPVCGLAKQYEELYFGKTGDAPIRFPMDSAAMKVLQRIRDEAHRFALTYHRKLRNRRIKESILDDIPGVGEKKKSQLLDHFGSVDRLRSASAADIEAVPGFGRVLATLIHRHLVDAPR